MQGYNNWAQTYDTDVNLTRDLDAHVTRTALGNLHVRTILEIGCGTGKNTIWLAQQAPMVMALDFSEPMLSRARDKIKNGRVYFSQADLNQYWPIAKQSIDLIVGNLVLEHIADLDFIFAQAGQAVEKNGHFFICELHPFKQYQGKQAIFIRKDETTAISAFVHHISDYLTAAAENGFALESLREWWHEEDDNRPPRLVSFLFVRK